MARSCGCPVMGKSQIYSFGSFIISSMRGVGNEENLLITMEFISIHSSGTPCSIAPANLFTFSNSEKISLNIRMLVLFSIRYMK